MSSWAAELMSKGTAGLIAAGLFLYDRAGH
jgi:hypothetical protein